MPGSGKGRVAVKTRVGKLCIMQKRHTAEALSSDEERLRINAAEVWRA